MAPDDAEKLRQVVRVLTEVQEAGRGFDMTQWQCETAACAIGWSVRDAWFQARGLSAGKYGAPCYQGKEGWRAVWAFFPGLPMETVNNVFAVDRYRAFPWERQAPVRLPEVVARITALLAEEPA